MGASGARVLVGVSPMQEAPVAQVRPVWQQPPPREAGQENQPVEQVYAVREEDEVGGGVVVEGEGVVEVWAAVEVGAGGAAVVEEEEGGMKVVDVASRTPVRVSIYLITISCWWCVLDLHPTPWHLNPGIQHPPFGEPGQLEYPLAVSQLTFPAQVCPLGQHPTFPASELPLVFMQLLPVPQQTSGAPIDSQLFVPSGHLNWRLSSTSRMCMRANQSDWASGRKGETACTARLPRLSESDLRDCC